MKKILLLLAFFPFLFYSQAYYWNQTNQQKGNKMVEATFNLGKNNIGGGLMVGYYIDEFMLIRAGGTFRQFEYKKYSENILEGDIDFVYTFYSPRYADGFINKFNTAAVGGFAIENVKVTSKTELIDPYPRYYYFYLGGQAEYMISERFGVIGNFKQMYALNGSKEKIGNWRYDFGLSVRYYLWSR